MALFTSVCNSGRESVVLPESSWLAIDCSTPLRLSAVTPVRPISARSVAVRAGLGVPPAAVSWMALAMRARLLISATVSTPVVLWAPTMALSRARLSVSLAAAPMSAPMAAYCVAVGFTPGVASAVAPLASLRMAE